jgi:Mrp family chromosome partitioning ATPase
VTWPWKRRDLEERVQQLEQANIRILGILESVAQTMAITGRSTELEAEIQALRGQIPPDRGDQPYHW